MKVCVVGQGYIGLPTAALFAKHNCDVVGVDINKEMIDDLNNGIVHIEEPGISESINNAIVEGRYHASLSPEEADVFIITVPTPYLVENLSCDLSYVINACESIVDYLKSGNTVIIESTIAPGSTEESIKPILEKSGLKVGIDIYLAHCPERVLPGQIMYELVNNNRIIGGVTEACTEKASEAYGIFVKGKLLKTEAKTAELSKCMENTFRDVNIALANELTKICAKIGVNALDVIELANQHPRVNIHNPGPGVGGHCLAIDPYFVYSKAPDDANIIKLSRDTNNSMPQFTSDKAKLIIQKHTNHYKPKIAILGVSYKGNTGDTRESPAFEIISNLEKEGYSVGIHDPHVSGDKFLSLEEALQDASIALILADHDEFKKLDYDLFKENMENPIIFDTKNIIDDVPDYIKLFNFGNLYKI
ncbi:nucleotide sugar dehydrogenase [Methanobrevibacter sp.]